MGVEPEFADDENVVFICTPFNSENDFTNLRNAIKLLNKLDKDFVVKEKSKIFFAKACDEFKRGCSWKE